jgi:hypothetical protein
MKIEAKSMKKIILENLLLLVILIVIFISCLMSVEVSKKQADIKCKTIYANIEDLKPKAIEIF